MKRAFWSIALSLTGLLGWTPAISQAAEPDTTPPYAEFVYPRRIGERLSGTVTLSAIVSDDVAVTRMQLINYDAGAVVPLGSDVTGACTVPWSAGGCIWTIPLDTNALSVGAHTLRIQVWDAAGNSSMSTIGGLVLVYRANDTAAPVLSSITTSQLTSRSTLIHWVTNEYADSRVDYGTTTSYGTTLPINVTMIYQRNPHSISLTNLTPLTTYHYRVRSRDSSGNETVSSDQTFTTLADPTIDTSSGWVALPNTQQQQICTPNHELYPFSYGCATALIGGWGSSIWDPQGKRLLLLGGGHSSYAGNEVQALNGRSLAWERLSESSGGFVLSGWAQGAPAGLSPDIVLPDGNPVSRHIYDHITYLSDRHAMWLYGGSLFSGSGGFGSDTWLLDLDTMQWTEQATTGATPVSVILASEYDSVTGQVYATAGVLYTYDVATRVWTQRTAQSLFDRSLGTQTAEIDPVRRLLVVAGGNGTTGGTYTCLLDTPYTCQQLVTSGATEVETGWGLGLAYDPVRRTIVAWNDRDPAQIASVYELNLATNTWTRYGGIGGPTYYGVGSYGRWRYVPEWQGFVAISKYDANVYVWRFGTLVPDTIAPSVPTGLSGVAGSSSQINLSWTASTDNLGVASYQVYRCTGNCSPTTQIGSNGSPNYTDTGLTASTTYTYAIVATDAAGNTSPSSATVSVATQAGVPPVSVPCTINVGPTRTYTNPSAAAAVVNDGDTVCIDAATYLGLDSIATWDKNNVTIIGVGGRPVMDAWSGYGGLGTWVLRGNNITIENIEFMCASQADPTCEALHGPYQHSGGGDAGLRIKAPARDYTVRNCSFHDNTMGILGSDHMCSISLAACSGNTPCAPGAGTCTKLGTVTIEGSEFYHNGAPFGFPLGHNVYISAAETLIFKNNYSHSTTLGHLLKTRAATNYILYNRLTDESGVPGYGTSEEIDIPLGGLTYIIGNVMEKAVTADSFQFIKYGAEFPAQGQANAVQELSIINNTMVSHYASTVAYVTAFTTPTTPLVLRMQNNVLRGRSGDSVVTFGRRCSVDPWGSCTSDSQCGVGICLPLNIAQQTIANNTAPTTDPLFISPATYDYRVLSTSPAIDAAIDPGSADGFSLTPTMEYVHPAGSASRPLVGPLDIGAYEYTSAIGGAGDLNADGLVDAVDLQLLVNVLLGTEIRAEVVGRADLDGQGGVNAADLQQLVNRLLGV